MSSMHKPSTSTHRTTDGTEPTVHHTTARQRRGRPPAKMQLNLTSMIDVIFQLLIYFVLTASFAFGEGVLTAELPARGQASQPPEIPPAELVVRLRPDGPSNASISLGQSAAGIDSFTGLYDQLRRVQYDPDHGLTEGYHKPDWPVIIQPEGEVRWQHVVNAFNAAIRARYTNVSFAQPRR